jgi:hypothetical protein
MLFQKAEVLKKNLEDLSKRTNKKRISFYSNTIYHFYFDKRGTDTIRLGLNTGLFKQSFQEAKSVGLGFTFVSEISSFLIKKVNQSLTKSNLNFENWKEAFAMGEHLNKYF